MLIRMNFMNYLPQGTSTGHWQNQLFASSKVGGILIRAIYSTYGITVPRAGPTAATALPQAVSNSLQLGLR